MSRMMNLELVSGLSGESDPSTSSHSAANLDLNLSTAGVVPDPHKGEEMEMKKMYAAVTLAGAALVTVVGTTASAAPNLGVTTASCTLTKTANGQYTFTASASYSAPNIAVYKINGKRFYATTKGGQQAYDTGLVAIAPTNVDTFDYTTVVNKTSAAALKSVTYTVYNGGAAKGTATGTCSMN